MKSKILPLCGLFVLSGLLGACENNKELEPYGNTPEAGVERFFALGKWKQIPAPLSNQVEVIALDHRTSYSSGSATLSDGKMAGLHSFLRENGVSGSDKLTLSGPLSSGGGHDALTASRLGSLVEEIRRAGLHAEISAPQEGAKSVKAGEVLVTVWRTVVLTPDCATSQPEVGARPDYHYSCSTVANLGAMVANPSDLVEGRDPGPATAEPNAAAINRYRSGATTPLVKETTN